jgi:hypothetical protein
MNGMRDKGGRTMSDMRELTTPVNEVAILEIRSEKSEKNARTNQNDKTHTSNPVKLPIHYPSEQTG